MCLRLALNCFLLSPFDKKKNIPHTFHVMLGTKCGSAGEFDELRAAALRFLIIQETLASADFTSNQQRHSLKIEERAQPAAGGGDEKFGERCANATTLLFNRCLCLLCSSRVRRDSDIKFAHANSALFGLNEY